MKKPTVLITPVNGRNAGTEAYQALRLSGRAGRIIVTDIIPFSYGAHLGEEFHVQPYASSAAYLPFLRRLIRREKITVLIPGSDYELRTVARHRAELERLGARLLINNTATVDLCLDKGRLPEHLRARGCAVPRTCILRRADSWAAVRRAVGSPCIVKPRAVSGGSAGVRLLQGVADWRAFVRETRGGTDNYIAQEYIDAAAAEYTVGVMSAPDGTLISSFALRRDFSNSASVILRVARRGGGEPLIVSSGLSQGRADDYPAVRRAAEQVARAVGSTGPLNVQGRWRNRCFHVFEINPRFSGTTAVRAALGHNDVALIWDAVLRGRNRGQARYPGASVVRGKSVLAVARGRRIICA